MTGYTIIDIQNSADGTSVTVELHTKDKPVRMHFELARKDVGRKKGCLMTKSLTKES